MASVVDNMTDILGKAGLPVWLSPERFLLPDFDADTCVSDLRRYVPLSTLQTELNSYLSLLKTKLVEVINEDYSDYVGLAGKLTGVEGAVLRMRRPLGELKDKLTVVQEAVRSELAALHQGLKKRKEVATARSLLELLQEVAHVASKVDKLLAEVAASDPSLAATAPKHDSTGTDSSTSPSKTSIPAVTNGNEALLGVVSLQGSITVSSDLDSYARLLERVAGEVSRLAFLSARGKDLAFVRTLEPRVASSRADLSSRLHTTLVTALTLQRHPATLHCLHAFVELGRGEVAEECVRTVVVAPLVKRCIAEHRKTHPRSGSREDELSSLLTSVLAAVQDALAPVLTAALSPHSALRSLDLLGNALLQEVQATLATSLPGVFSPGIPPIFHANYLAALKFLESLEAMCHSRGSVDRLRASLAHAAFLRRWNLSVYFSLLYQEIAGELEEQTAIQQFLPTSSSTSGSSDAIGSKAGGGSSSQNVATAMMGISPHLSITHTLLLCLNRSVSCEIFLPSLGDRFFRLVLQLVQRYATWAASAVSARSAQGLDTATPTPSSITQQQLSSSASPSLLSQSSVGSGQASLSIPAVGAEAGSMVWVAGASAEELSMLLHDCEAVAGALGSWLLPALAPLLGPVVPPTVLESVREALQTSSSSLQAQSSALLDILSSEVGEQCCGVVKALKAIAATYRMTTKGPPVRHSHYAAGVLAPLATLLASPQVQRLQPSTISSLTLAVVEVVNARFRQLAEELLMTVRKTESSLKRLKKNRPGDATEGGEASGAMADSDKIALQLHLDVQEYGRHIAELGLDPKQLSSYKTLIEAVAVSHSTPAAVSLPSLKP